MVTKPLSEAPSQADEELVLNIYQTHVRHVTSVCGRYISNPADREDIVQETMLHLISKADTLCGLDAYAVTAYVNITARNTAISFLRKQASKQKHLELAGQIRLAEDAAAFDDPHQVVWYREQLQRIWSGLSESELALLTGRYILGYTDEELAAQRHCKASSIRMMLSRVRRKAMDLLRDQEEGAV